MQPKARMTFRFDPPAAPPKEDKHFSAPSPAAKEERKEPSVTLSALERYEGGPLQDDPYTLEELIRSYETQSSFSPAVGRSKKRSGEPDGPLPEPDANEPPAQEETFGWTLPETALPVRKGQAPFRESGPSRWRAWTSVAGAIVTGALFGYLVLLLFAGEPMFPSNAGNAPAPAAAPSQGAEAPASGALAGEMGTGGAALGEPAAVLSLPKEEYYFLQYGVFRTEEGLDAALAALSARGLPAAPGRLDGYRAYAGAALSREMAELLAGQMPDVEVYIRPLTVGAVRAQMPEEAGAFVVGSHQLARQLLRMSVLALQDDRPQPFEEEELAALQESHRRWMQTVEAAQLLPGNGRQAGAAMIRSMNEAMAHVEDYGASRSRFHLWGIQRNMMELILQDQAWRASLEGA